MTGALDGKVVAVVGASGCYGAAAARALSREGASLVLGARSRQPLEELQSELEQSRTLVVGTDVTRRRHLERLVEVALERFGSLDALVYAARVRPAMLQSLDAGSWGDCVDVNVRGFLYAAGAALPAMLDRGGGHIVDLASGEEDGALERAVGSARRNVREGLRAELSGRGVSVSEIAPGPDSAKRVCQLFVSTGG